MASLKEETTTATLQDVDLRSAILPDADIQGERQSSGKTNIEASNPQREELYAQLPMMPPVLLSPTGIRLLPEQKSITVRVAAAPHDSLDYVGFRGNLYSEVFGLTSPILEGKKIDAITNVTTLSGAVDSLIELSKSRDKKLGDVRIISHGAPGQILLFVNKENLDSPYAISEFARLRPFLEQDAVITFHACDVGEDTKGLQKIANATGATVRASLDPQIGIPGLQGRIVTVTPQDSKKKQ